MPHPCALPPRPERPAPVDPAVLGGGSASGSAARWRRDERSRDRPGVPLGPPGARLATAWGLSAASRGRDRTRPATLDRPWRGPARQGPAPRAALAGSPATSLDPRGRRSRGRPRPLTLRCPRPAGPRPVKDAAVAGAPHAPAIGFRPRPAGQGPESPAPESGGAQPGVPIQADPAAPSTPAGCQPAAPSAAAARTRALPWPGAASAPRGGGRRIGRGPGAALARPGPIRGSATTPRDRCDWLNPGR